MAAAPNAEAVSIRAVASAVGVTPPSIYLHFADKNALMTAVVLEVFEQLDSAMIAAGEGVSDPLERLRLYGLAYIRFAVAHPEHYRLATMDPCPRPDLDEMFAKGAWVHIFDVVTECIAAGVFPAASDATAITLDLWAAVHGLAALMAIKPYMPWGDFEETANRVLGAAAMGHTVLDPANWLTSGRWRTM
jgi:AcrR family transcriptional regulator